jgi:hypothetical protein
METLSKDWLTTGLVDFEYKKYVLLAYLKQVKQFFGRVELYPYLADLVFHYKNLTQIKENKSMLVQDFPKELSLENLKNLELNYKRIVEDDAVMAEIEAIIEFALPRFKNALQDGAEIYDFVESQCEIQPVGISSLYKNEGYLLVAQPPQNQADIYRYQISVFENSLEPLRSLQTNFIETQRRTLASGYEQMKLSLLKRFKDLPNPATFLVVSKSNFPNQQTLMPVVKRMFIKHLAQAA